MTTVHTRPVDPPLTSRTRLGGSLAFLGPAVVAGIAYVDPGNVATNFEAGARYGYRLLWVVIAANVMAALMQYLAAKLGLVSGMNLAQVSRLRYGPRPAVALWLQAEVVAMATDLAEVVGGALALQLLFGLPLWLGATGTALCAYGLLALQQHGRGRFERVVAFLFVVIAVGVCVNAAWVHPSPVQAAAGLVPGVTDSAGVVLATAIVGATVMPHALYVHSALTQHQLPATPAPDWRRILRAQRASIGLAIGVAGVVNAAMLITAAGGLRGVTGGIPGYHAALIRSAGALGGFVFVVTLLASGLASTGVGTLAGEAIMAGFVQRTIPRPVRRLTTLLPGLILLFVGVPATSALIVSQLILGVAVPLTLIPLIAATSDIRLMGPAVNSRAVTTAAVCCAAAITAVAVYALITTIT